MLCALLRLLLCLLLARYGALRPLADACVRLGALPAYRQAASMPQATVAADFDQAADTKLERAPQVTFYLKVPFDDLTQLAALRLRQFADAGGRVDTRLRHDLPGAG